MRALSPEQRHAALLQLRDDVINDCQGRDDSEALDHRLRLAATLDACAANLSGGLSLEAAELRIEAVQ